LLSASLNHKTPTGFPVRVLRTEKPLYQCFFWEFPREGMILHSEALLPWLPYRFAVIRIRDQRRQVKGVSIANGSVP
jgi:hypothetical protein